MSGSVSALGANPSTISVNFAIPGSAANGTIITGTITAYSALVPGSETVVIPPNQRWYFYAVSTQSGPTGPDGRLQVLKNGDIQYFQPFLSQTSLSVLRGYTFPQKIRFLQNSTLNILLVLSEANSATTQVTQTVQFDVIKYAFAVA